MLKMLLTSALVMSSSLSLANPTVTYQGPIETSPQVTAQGLKGLCKQQHIIVKNSAGKLPAYYNEYICYSGDGATEQGVTSDFAGLCLQKVMNTSGYVQHHNANGDIERLEQYTLPLRAGCEIGLF